MKDMHHRLAILLPVFNEKESLPETLRRIADEAAEDFQITVYLVDDGSDLPVNECELPPPTRHLTLVLTSHAVNLGQGAALETARRLALEGCHTAFITMDADGQHPASALRTLVAALDAGADVVFGNRFLGASNVPRVRGIVLHAARRYERWLTGLSLSDAHNGFRAFSRRGIESIRIRQNRMAHATEIIQQVAAAKGLRHTEVPVTVLYSRTSAAKGQSCWGGVRILRDLLYDRLFGGMG